MTSNPHLRRLLGENAPPPAPESPEGTDDAAPPAQDQAAPPPAAPPQEADPQAEPLTQELAQLWKSGDQMAVATKLMFTPASYVGFVDLIFIIGHADGRKLGQLLDELADSENIEPPKTPPGYRSLLKRVAGADEEEGIV